MTLPSTTEVEEGEQCYVFGCTGRFEFKRKGSCTCFQSAPCSSCTDSPLACTKCDTEIEHAA